MDGSAAAERAPLPEPPLGGPWRHARILALAAVLAAVGVLAGTAWQDGPLSGAAEVVGRRLLKQSWWRLPGALLLGVLLQRYYRDLLDPERVRAHKGRLSLWAVARMFAHFPFIGVLALCGLLAGMAGKAVDLLRGRAERPDRPPAIDRWIGVPLWFMALPFIVMELSFEGDLTLPRTVPQAALLRRWLPALVPVLLLWTGATSEGSGERVDPYWLAAFATFWIGDYLLVALRVTPILRARRGLAP